MKAVVCLVLLFSATFLRAQSPLSHRLEQNFDVMALDKLGGFYTIKNHTIIKYNSDFNPIYQFNDNKNGKISQVDLSNPLQLLILYQDYNQALILDRTLSEQSRLDLSELAAGYTLQAVALSSDNNLWIFNPSSFRLEKISREGEPIKQSADLSLLVETADFQPTFLTELDNKIYLYEPQNGLLVFDIFANFSKKIELEASSVQLYNQKIYLLQNGEAYAYDLGTWEQKRLELGRDLAGCLQLLVFQQQVFLRYADRIEVLSFQ